MLRLEWRESAIDDLDQIVTYIAQQNFPAAERIRMLAEEAAQRISEHPYSHRPGRLYGTREAVIHPNYILIYQVANDAVAILNVLHSRQQYP